MAQLVSLKMIEPAALAAAFDTHMLLLRRLLGTKLLELNFFDERLREMEVAVTRDPMRSKAARLRDELIRLERKQQLPTARCLCERHLELRADEL